MARFTSRDRQPDRPDERQAPERASGEKTLEQARAAARMLRSGGPAPEPGGLTALQRSVGNAAFASLIAERQARAAATDGHPTGSRLLQRVIFDGDQPVGDLEQSAWYRGLSAEGKKIAARCHEDVASYSIDGVQREIDAEAARSELGRSNKRRKITTPDSTHDRKQPTGGKEKKEKEDDEEWEEQEEDVKTPTTIDKAPTTTTTTTTMTGRGGAFTRPVFGDTDLKSAEAAAFSGQMHSLDLVTYNFGVDKEGRHVEGGEFTGLFKPVADTFGNAFASTRGPYSGLTNEAVKLIERNLAAQAVDKLLAADVIAPTWRARHGDKDGIVMQKIDGKFGADLSAEQQAAPAFRRGLSNLYLLDIICAQVDRHSRNYIVEFEDDTIVGVQGIDNDMAFGAAYETKALGWEKYHADKQSKPQGSSSRKDDIPAQLGGRLDYLLFRGMFGQYGIHGKYVQELEEIDKGMAQRIVALAEQPDELRTALKALLSEAEVEAAVKRLTSLAAFLTQLIESNDKRIVAEWK